MTWSVETSFELGRTVNHTILTEDELADRRTHRDRFIASVDAGPTLPVIEPPNACAVTNRGRLGR